MNRRGFIRLIGGAAAAWPLAARPQQPLPVIALVNARSADAGAIYAAAFRKGLAETGYVEGRDVTVEPYWLEGQLGDNLPVVMRDLVRRRVAVIATVIAERAAMEAKAATSTIPIVFTMGSDPVSLGLVASLNRPGGNATGMTLLSGPLLVKRVELARELLPRTDLLAVLTNPTNPENDDDLKYVQEAVQVIGQRLLVLEASTEFHLPAAFVTLVQQGAKALLVGSDVFFNSRREWLVALAARDAVPMIHFHHEAVQAGALMSYGASITDIYRQVGVYVSRILKGEKPADLPVVQPSRFELAINLKTAKTLGLNIPPLLLALANEVIE